MAEHTTPGQVELGFVEKIEDPTDLDSSNFPSKVGGKPVWLNPASLPSPNDLSCKECSKPCVLLLQVYAPHTDDAASFHRTLYIFMCTDPSCFKPGSTKPFRVLRCQLPKVNPYYSIDNDSDTSREDATLTREDTTSTREDATSREEIPHSSTHPNSRPPLCSVCGSHGPSRCGQCYSVHYCSSYHQLHHWKNGHKRVCKDLKSGKNVTADGSIGVSMSSLLLPELLIVTETEPEEKNEGKKNAKTEQQRLKEYEQFLHSDAYQASCHSNSAELLDQLSKMDNGGINKNNDIDKIFMNFKKRVDRDPEQVIRFQPGGDPLSMNTSTAVTIPVCEACGGNRQFELQVMPQLLYYLNIDDSPPSKDCSQSGSSIDWGTILIYTCANDCDTLPAGYRDEFLWKQDLVS